MQINSFFISDASYNDQNKIASLAVKDLHTLKSYATSMTNINNCSEAEYLALLFAVKTAIKNKVDNPIFCYDNINLNLDTLKEYCKKKFKTAQFLWLKREYVDEVDKLARKTRKMFELTKETTLCKASVKINQQTFDKHISSIQQKYNTHQKRLELLQILCTKDEIDFLSHIFLSIKPKQPIPNKQKYFYGLNCMVMLYPELKDPIKTLSRKLFSSGKYSNSILSPKPREHYIEFLQSKGLLDAKIQK